MPVDPHFQVATGECLARSRDGESVSDMRNHLEKAKWLGIEAMNDGTTAQRHVVSCLSEVARAHTRHKRPDLPRFARVDVRIRDSVRYSSMTS
jgi:hypothetical protein